MTDHESLPPPEQLRSRDFVITDVPGRGLTATVRYHRRIDKYLACGELVRKGEDAREGARRHDAAVKYLTLAEAARPHGCQSTLGGGGDRIDTNPSPDGLTINRLDAMADLTRAQQAIGPNHVACLDAVVVEDIPAHRWCMDNYYRRRIRLLADGKRPKRTKPRKSEGIRALREALESLAKHWRL